MTPLKGILDTKLGSRMTVLIGGTLLSIGTFLSAFCTSLLGTLFTYGCLFGAGIGISYSAPIVCSVKWMPEQKGLITGIIVAGFGSGNSISFIVVYLKWFISLFK